MNDMAFSPKLLCVAPNKTAEIWPHVSAMIDAGYRSADEEMPVNLLERLASGDVLLWIAVSDNTILAALITALVKRRSGLVCKLISAGGGSLDIWKSWHVRIEEYARAEGCVRMESECRPGFLRALTGYSISRLVIEKRL